MLILVKKILNWKIFDFTHSKMDQLVVKNIKTRIKMAGTQHAL